MKKILALVASIMMLGTLAFALSGCSDSPFVKALENASDKAESITASFDGIEIVSDTADLTLVASDECKIEYTTHKKIIYSTEVENGVLKIKLEDNRRWFQKIFSFGYGNKLTVYLPAGEYSSLTINQATGDIAIPGGYTVGDVKIDLSTGDVCLNNVTCGNFNLKMSTGDVFINGINCANFTSTGSTGDISIGDMNANGDVYVKRSTGAISVNTAAISGKLETKVSDGKSFLTNVSCTNFASAGNTGDIDMTSLVASERIDITRTTGDVTFDRCDAAEITVSVSTGDVTGTLLTPKIFQAHATTGKINVPEYWEGGKCKITTTTGKIEISIGQ